MCVLNENALALLVGRLLSSGEFDISGDSEGDERGLDEFNTEETGEGGKRAARRFESGRGAGKNERAAT